MFPWNELLLRSSWQSEVETITLYWDFYILEIKAKENFPNVWFYEAQHKKEKMQDTSTSPLFQ